MVTLIYILVAFGVLEARQGRDRQIRVAFLWPYYLGMELAKRYL